MSPILKNKQRRDTLLFWGMLALTMAFLLYMFWPKSAPASGKSVKSEDVSGAEIEAGEAEDTTFSGRLESLLSSAFTAAVSGFTSLERAPFVELSAHLDKVGQLGRTGSGREALRRWRMDSRSIGIFELGDPRILAVPEFVPPRLAFRIYLALFILKSRDPESGVQLRDASCERLLRILDAEIFRTVEWEIRFNAAAYPILAVFQAWLERTDVYPNDHPGHEWAEHLDRFRDLSPDQLVTRLRHLMDYSTQVRTFSLEWIEDDGIFGSDRGVYAELRLRVHRFLGQEYVIMPGAPGDASPLWLRELADSDAGGIELSSFRLIGAETPRPAYVPACAWYNPLGDRFIVVFSGSGESSEHLPPPLDRWIRDRRSAYHRGHHRLNLEEDASHENGSARKREMRRFGEFLKRLAGQP